MARLLNRIVVRMLGLAVLTTLITMLVGLAAWYVAMYYRLNAVMSHMPPRARAQLEHLVATNQQGTNQFFDLYARYGGDPPRLTDTGFIAVIALVSIAVGGVVATMLALRISRPITAVAEAAARVAAGDRSARVERGSASGETGDLVDSFNRMAADIAAYERERTVLTAGIAHELRTPLTILKGRLHGLEDGVIVPEPGETQRLLRQVEQLSRLVEDLRTLAHADADALDLNWQPLDLAPLVETLVTDLQPSAQAAGAILVYAGRPAQIVGDPVRLVQIVTNLITNAIKHSPGDGRVRITLVTTQSDAILTIMDEGGGFHPEDTGRLFMPFWRAQADTDQERPGSGLGLALAAKLAEAHRGAITAANRDDRSGACFALRLPLAAHRR